MPLAIRQFIDADRQQALQRVVGPTPVHHPLYDLPDRDPRDVEQLLHGRLVAPLDQEVHRLLEAGREPRGCDGAPRHRLHDHATCAAGHPPQPIPEIDAHPAEIEMPPAPRRPRVVVAPSALTARTPGRPPRRANLDDERPRLNGEAGDPQVLHAQQRFQ